MVVAPDDYRIEQIGFAKFLSEDLEVCAKKYEIVIGRNSKSSYADVILGDNMNISRQHAKIQYNFERGTWELHVLGKNGVTVQGTLHTAGSPPVVLRSQDKIQIADRSFYFLLPRQEQWCAPRDTPHQPPAAVPAAATSPLPAQHQQALPPGGMAAQRVVQQLAASLPLPQHQVMRALAAQQLVQQQRQQQQGSASMGPPEQQASAASHAALPQPSRAAPGLPLSANWGAVSNVLVPALGQTTPSDQAVQQMGGKEQNMDVDSS